METIKSYMPEGTLNFDSEHGILLTFRFDDATAQLYTVVGGNVSGSEVLEVDLYNGLTVPVDHELTKKHAVLDLDEDPLKYQYVDEVIFHYPDGDTVYVSIDDVDSFLVGVQIVEYFPEGE